MLGVHIFLARIGKTESPAHGSDGWPGAPFVPIAFPARVIKIGIVHRLLWKSVNGAEVINLEEFLAAEREFIALTVCAKAPEVPPQNGR
jgi:hypothetical protein